MIMLVLVVTTIDDSEIQLTNWQAGRSPILSRFFSGDRGQLAGKNRTSILDLFQTFYHPHVYNLHHSETKKTRFNSSSSKKTTNGSKCSAHKWKTIHSLRLLLFHGTNAGVLGVVSNKKHPGDPNFMQLVMIFRWEIHPLQTYLPEDVYFFGFPRFICQMSHEKKKTALPSIESWLVKNRDPYEMA